MKLKIKLLIILTVLPILTMSSYRLVVGDLFSKDKMNFIYDTLVTKNEKQQQILEQVFKKNRIYDTLVMKKIRSKIDSESIVESLILNDKDLLAYKIYQIKQRTPMLYISRTNGTKNDVPFKTIESLWRGHKQKVQLKPFFENSYLLATSFEEGNQSYLIVKTIDLSSLVDSQKESVDRFILLDSKQRILIETFGLGASRNLIESDAFKEVAKTNVTRAMQVDLESGEYVLAYTPVYDNYSFVTLLPKDEMLAIVKELDTKSILFLLVLVGLAGLLSLVSTSKITRTVESLINATTKIKDGDYQIEIPDKSNDEFGILAKSFEKMSSQIHSLMKSLSEQNEMLEVTVEERTKELNHALSTQKAMTESLDEGFMILNSKGKFLSQSTLSCEKIFGFKPEKKFIGDVLEVDESEHDDLMAMCGVIFQEKAPFDDLKLFLPEYVTLESNKIILCEYFPMRDADQKITGIVVTVQDKTNEMIAIEEGKKQSAYAKMVTTILKDKNNYFEFIEDIKKFVIEYKQRIRENDVQTDLLLRMIHTFKSVALYFNIIELAEVLDQKESQLETGKYDVSELINDIELKVIEVTASQESWLGQNAYSTAWERSKSISFSTLQKFAHFMKTEDVPGIVYQMFVENLASRPLMSIFEKYDDLLKYLSVSEGIKIDKIEWTGFDLNVPVNIYHELFNSYVHIYRNIMSHAFSSSSDQQNIISSSASLVNTKTGKMIKFIIKDNGNGVDLETIKKKYHLEDKTDIEILNFIFDDKVSTENISNELSGRGVGLSAVKEKIKQYGGTISVSSVKNEGTSFEILIPFEADFIVEGAELWDKAA